jgi:beta-N-acetylhexosaminidase
MKLLTLLILAFNVCVAMPNPSEQELKQMIGKMLIVGFDGERVTPQSDIYMYIRDYNLSGVILFDRDYHDRNQTKNIKSPQQLQALTAQLQAISPNPLIISIDQEGGKVARMKPKYGFKATPSAYDIANEHNITYAKQQYDTLAQELQDNGITCNFAPVVDLAVEPKNRVIYQLHRAYSKEVSTVVRYANIFINALNDHGVISVLKHFPGHGSSLADSHQGFVDVTKTWNAKELEPYAQLIKRGAAEMIMTAHVFNKHLDATYPATLSYKINTKLLRQQMGYKGVIISDDLQMKAISNHYDLKQTVTRAINSGIDMLLFGNQLAHQDLKALYDLIYQQVRAKKIPLSRIIQSNKRIDTLLKKQSKIEHIVQKPIDFTPKRIAMTKAYIQTHYDLNVSDILIEPKVIVLHWTAIMDANASYQRLKRDTLFTDRTDIANAGLLNVSAHFLVERDGTINQLMPENMMARHVIGLNYSSIGIENVGGENNTNEDLTQAQVQANVELIRYLKQKYPTISYLIGHHEYRAMEQTPLWLEKDKGYRTVKSDPGATFMSAVRQQLEDLNLKQPPKESP